MASRTGQEHPGGRRGTGDLVPQSYWEIERGFQEKFFGPLVAAFEKPGELAARLPTGTTGRQLELVLLQPLNNDGLIANWMAKDNPNTPSTLTALLTEADKLRVPQSVLAACVIGWFLEKEALPSLGMHELIGTLPPGQNERDKLLKATWTSIDMFRTDDIIRNSLRMLADGSGSAIAFAELLDTRSSWIDKRGPDLASAMVELLNDIIVSFAQVFALLSKSLMHLSGGGDDGQKQREVSGSPVPLDLPGPAVLLIKSAKRTGTHQKVAPPAATVQATVPQATTVQATVPQAATVQATVPQATVPQATVPQAAIRAVFGSGCVPNSRGPLTFEDFLSQFKNSLLGLTDTDCRVIYEDHFIPAVRELPALGQLPDSFVDEAVAVHVGTMFLS